MPGEGNGEKVRKQPLKKKNKRTFFSYSTNALKRALSEIRENNMSVREASRQFGVPRTTIQDRLKGRIPENILRKTGPPPIMTREGEQKIANWLLDIAKCGFPMKKSDLIDTVTKIARDSGKLHLFKNQQPGQKWYQNFLKRHPEISLREAEGINKARALITEESVRKWFRDLQLFIQNNNLEDVMEDPQRIFNGDESGFSLCPKTGKVLAPKGWKNLYIITSGKEKENITVFLIFNADGKVCPPFVVFPYIRPPRALVESMPPTWILGKSNKGWMTGELFFEYISNDFNKWLLQEKIPKPVIVFIDGHRSHMSLPLSTFCDSNGIVLYALPPNTTHMLQPADVSVFRPLKQEWRTTIRKWLNRPENVNSSVTKLNFCTLFQETLQGTNTTDQIKNGFRKCGLFPLNPDNVDYSKCVKNILENRLQKSGLELNESDLAITEKVIRTIETKLYTYGVNVQVIYNEINELRPKHQEIAVGTVLPLDTLTILPIQDVILSNLNESQEMMVPESDVQEVSLQDPALLNPLTDLQDNDTTDEPPLNTLTILPIQDVILSNLNESQEMVVPESDVQEDSSQNPSLLNRLTDLQDNDTTDEQDESNINEKGEVHNGEEILREESNNSSSKEDKENEQKIEKMDRNKSECLVEETETTTENKRNEIANQENRNITKPIPIETVSEKDVDPFETHLFFPEALKKSETKVLAAKQPSAISSQAWRTYYLKKEREKDKKIEQIKLKKLQREANLKQKQIEKSSKKKKNRRQCLKNNENIEETIATVEKEKIKCTLCEDDLISDTDDDLEKNIGCDYCTNWYHLKCTDFLNLTYEVAASKEYKCDLCK